MSASERREVLGWLTKLHPLWERRYSTRRPPPRGQAQRTLLRPVYWLGSWQFACLDYYRPPKGVADRAVRAEPFPPVMKAWVSHIERGVHRAFAPEDVPRGWHLNTCLVNLYGAREGKDAARVGEHRDFEPGPVASVSLGERALFQFVTSSRPGSRDAIVAEQWLDDGSLQVFGGEQWKRRTFHRVQRVDKRGGHRFPPPIAGFVTRRVNFTFRWVPDEHIVDFTNLGAEAKADVRPYVEELAAHSAWWRRHI